MPIIPSAILSDDLEERTGADFMITPLNAPIATDMLLKRHIEAGALLVQRKHGLDLSSSVSERLNSSLAKMHKWTQRPAQCVLLFVGILSIGKQGKAIINKQNTHLSYWTVLGAMEKWKDRGGTVTQLPRKSLVEEWINRRTKHIEEYQANPVKQIYPDKPVVQAYDKFLQTLMPIDDGRITLATLPGIGPKLADVLWNELNGDMAEILCWLTDPPSKFKTKEIKGIGPTTIRNIRKYLNVDDVMRLTLEVMREELWQKD